MNIIIKPIITEKSMKQAATGAFTFLVATEANKAQIRKAVESMFKVTVIKIATMMTRGRSYRTGARRVEATRQPLKKALVTLKEGQTIALFDLGA